MAEKSITISIQKAKNGYLIMHGEKLYVAKNTMDIGRIISNILDDIEPMEIQK